MRAGSTISTGTASFSPDAISQACLRRPAKARAARMTLAITFQPAKENCSYLPSRWAAIRSSLWRVRRLRPAPTERLVAGVGCRSWLCGDGDVDGQALGDGVRGGPVAVAYGSPEVALGVIGHRSRATRFHRQRRMGAIRCLALGLLIGTEHHRTCRRIHLHPNDIDELLFEPRIVADLEPLRWCRQADWACALAPWRSCQHQRLLGR